MHKSGEKSRFCGYHPIVLAVYYIMAIGITMFSNSPILLVISLVCAFFHALMLKGISHMGPTLVLMLVMVVLSVVVNGLFTHRGETVLFWFGHNRVTLEAMVYGLIMGLMIAAVIAWFSGFGVVMGSEKIIYLFGRIAPSLGLVISMILRFVPLMRKRYKEISDGQKCLGHKRGPRQTIKKISILISWSLEASIETADSMSARGYGLRHRTSYHLYRFRLGDALFLLAAGIIGAVTIYGAAVHSWDMYYYPVIRTMRDDVPFAVRAVALLAFTALMLIPLIVVFLGAIGERRRWDSPVSANGKETERYAGKI